MDQISQILSYLTKFSYKVALTFLSKSSKNAIFSPYSLFMALLLTSSINTDKNTNILNYLTNSNFEISANDQINQLQYLTKLVDTVPSIPEIINSSSFNDFISKYDFSNDQKYISYDILNKMIKQYHNITTPNKEHIISLILKSVGDYQKDSNLNKISQNYQYIIDNEIKQHPIIITSNNLFVNKKSNFSVPNLFSEKYSKHIYETEFPEPGYLEINKIVNESTRGLISDFISKSDLQQLSSYFVANTIYFKGLWEIPMKLLNYKKDFNTISGEVNKIDFLKSNNDFEFYEDEDLIYVNLNYKHSLFSFEIVMPKEIANFNSIRNNVYSNNGNLLNKISKETTKSKILLMIPKFTMKTDLMDFGNILNIQGVDSILQKAVIIVDEKGTEAAAASGVSTRSIELDQPKELMINRPLIFLIRDRNKNLPLFIGEFVKPIE